jgi:DHA2 family multidrug resistance protein
MLANGLLRHQAVLVERLNPLDPNYSDWMSTAGGLFGGGGSPGVPDPTALAVLYQQVQRQAAMLSFLDVFHALMIVVLIVSPVALLMRSPKRGQGGGGMAH